MRSMPSQFAIPTPETVGNFDRPTMVQQRSVITLHRIDKSPEKSKPKKTRGKKLFSDEKVKRERFNLLESLSVRYLRP